MFILLTQATFIWSNYSKNSSNVKYYCKFMFYILFYVLYFNMLYCWFFFLQKNHIVVKLLNDNVLYAPQKKEHGNEVVHISSFLCRIII